ncbi:MAG: NRAMP family divalent metal transporter [Halobacteriota archaeon]
MLWTFIPMTIALAIVQEMAVRMGVVSHKGLAALIREKAGIRVTSFVMIALLFANFGTTLAEFVGISVSAAIFGVPPLVSVPLASLFLWVLVLKGSYRSVERIFLIAVVLYVAYIISGFLAHPDWRAVAVATVIPQISLTQAYIVMLIGLVGTTISPWMQFYTQATVVEKGVSLKRLKYSRLDAISGSIASNVVAYFIVIACAATIFVQGRQVYNVADISAALAPVAGKYAGALFAFGFLNASLFAASILPLSTSYVVCEGLGFESGISKSFTEAPIFHGLYAGMIILAALIVLLPNVPLLSILFLSQVGLGILLPFVLIFMLIIINDKKVMGEYVNTRSLNSVAWATVIILIGLSVALIVIGFI